MKDFLREIPGETPTHTLEAIAPQPTLRIRVEHSRTVKDGWSYSTTVELDGVDAYDPRWVNEALDLISDTASEARKLGEIERDIRNERDNAMREAAAQTASTAS